MKNKESYMYKVKSSEVNHIPGQDHIVSFSMEFVNPRSMCGTAICSSWGVSMGIFPTCFSKTSYDRTSYLFSTTESFEKNLALLMNMVEQPYFTEETVAREVGIINEEIKMYQDNPGYKLYFETLNQMYHNSGTCR